MSYRTGGIERCSFSALSCTFNQITVVVDCFSTWCLSKSDAPSVTTGFRQAIYIFHSSFTVWHPLASPSFDTWGPTHFRSGRWRSSFVSSFVATTLISRSCRGLTKESTAEVGDVLWNTGHQPVNWVGELGDVREIYVYPGLPCRRSYL